jgi:hypothetical protein
MLTFDANAVYTLDDLQAALGEALSVSQFLDTLKVRKRFKKVVLGIDLVQALESARDDNRPEPVAVIKTGKRGRPRKVRESLGRILPVDLQLTEADQHA